MTEQEHVIRPDPRSPLVLDTRELGHRPGAMQKLRRTVPAPEDLGTDIIGVPAGSELEVDLRLESVLEGILVSGTARGRSAGECVRCLSDVELDVVADLQELYVWPGRAHDEDDDELREIEADLIDLEPALRDAVVLALPFQPVCREDCPGLCADCGVRLLDHPGHRHEVADPRWAALQDLVGDGSEPAADSADAHDDERES